MQSTLSLKMVNIQRFWGSRVSLLGVTFGLNLKELL
jgi:hypothetical protein